MPRPTFRRYPSLLKPHPKFLRAILAQVGETTCEATEKYHGCNVAYYTDGVDVWSARRSDFLAEDESFFGVRAWAADNHERILACHTGTGHTVVYGEFYGKNIQKHLDYGPDYKFVAFDIALLDGDARTFLSTTSARLLAESVGIPFVEAHFTGTFAECLDWSGRNFDAREGGREGHVIRPVSHTRMPSGDHLIVKHKSPAFLEMISQKNAKPVKPAVKRSDEWNRLLADYSRGITRNRFDAVMSKGGIKTFGHALIAFVKDLLAEPELDGIETLEGKERTSFPRQLRKTSAIKMSTWWKEYQTVFQDA